MKKIFLLLCVIVVFSAKKVNAQTQDSNITALLAINESSYINKPLDSIINVLPSGYIKMVVYGVRRTAKKVTILYPNRV